MILQLRMLLFFVYEYTISVRRFAPIFNIKNGFSGRKLYVVSAFRISFFKIAFFFNFWKKTNKKMKKHENLRKISFQLNRLLFFFILERGLIVKIWNFHWTLKLTVISLLTSLISEVIFKIVWFCWAIYRQMKIF